MLELEYLWTINHLVVVLPVKPVKLLAVSDPVTCQVIVLPCGTVAVNVESFEDEALRVKFELASLYVPLSILYST